MTTSLRNFSFGFLCMAFALAIAGCSTEETGATLTVTAWQGANPVNISRTPVPASFSATWNARVNYRGTKTLVYQWSVIQFPTTVGWTIVPDTTDPSKVVFTMSGEGVYVVQIEVFEKGGSISAKDQVTFILDDPTTPGTPRANG